MATPVFCCGFECGVDTGTTGHGVLTSATYNTTGSFVRSGARSLRCNGTASAYRATSGFTSSNMFVYRFYIYFSTLPTDNIVLCNPVLSTRAGAVYRTSDGKIYAGAGNTTNSESFGASGVSVTTGQWYRIDVRINSSANPWLVDVMVDGVACGQLSTAIASSTATVFRSGTTTSISISNYDYYLDDLIISNTTGDFPIGAGYVNHFVPTADGTHNVAGTNDFERSNSGTDINNATTTAFQLIDDVPLKSGVVSEYINLIAPVNATDYVEVVFGPASGISTPTVAPRGADVIVAHASATTGTHNIRLALNDNGSLDDVLNTNTAPGTSAAYARKHYADPPSAASAWTLSGNGNFNNVRMRCFSSDPAPDPWWASAMIEAEFTTVNAYSLTVDPATYTFTTENANIRAQRKIVGTNATYSFTPADATLRRGFKLVVQEATYSFTPADATFTKTRKLIVTEAAYSFTTQTAGLRAQRKLVVTEATYSFTPADVTFRIGRRFVVTAATYSFTTEAAAITAQRKLSVDPATYSFTTATAGILAQRKLPAVEAVYLFTTQDAGLVYDQPGSGNFNFSVDPATYSLTTQDAILRAQREINVDPATYSFTTQDAGLRTTRTFNVSHASYSFTEGTVNFLTGLFQPTYRFKVRGAKHRFNTKPVKMIVHPKRPGDIRMYERK